MTQLANYWDQTHPPRSQSSQEVAEQVLRRGQVHNEERFSPHPPREGDARVLETQAKSWYLLWHHLQAMRMPCEKPCSGHLIFPAGHQLRWQTSDCLCSGGSSNKRAGKRAGLGEGWQRCRPQSLSAAM